MPNYTVRIWRPSIDAATPEEAAQLSIATQEVDGDEFYVLENDPSGSVNYVVGAATIVGGVYPTPTATLKGPDFDPATTKVTV